MEIYPNNLECGGSGNFKVINNNLIKNLQLTNSPANDFVKVNYTYFVTFYNKSKLIGGSSSIQKINIKNNYIFAKIGGSEFSEILFNEFVSNTKYEEGKNPDSTYKGSDIPFSKIFYDHLNNMIYVKADVKYYCFSSQKDDYLDSITLYKSNSNELMTRDFKYFIYSYRDTIFFQNVKSKAIEDTLICPFIPEILTLSPDGNGLIAANNSGNIALFDKTILDVNENINVKNDLTISPNPATYFIYLPQTNEFIQYAAIFSIYGEKILTINNAGSNVVDVSGLSKGIYFLRINNKVYKFVKI
jgi:hypothetical protein